MALRFLNKTPFHLVLIALLGLLAYSNTFDVPFQWDDKYLIEQNPIIKDLNYFSEPSRAEGLEGFEALKGRYIGYLTFALNYKLHGLDVRGYHIVNILIHIINSLLVYFLVVLTFRTPYLNNPSFLNNPLIALFSALLFVSHPIQTEAVTYIFQRLASLCAFFYLLSLLLYIKSRLTEDRAEKYVFYALSLLSAVFAMKTKENAFTLPLVITLYELFFFKGPVTKRMLGLVPLLLTMLIIPLTLIGINKPVGEVISGINPSLGYEGIERWDYLLTQFRVIVTYIRLLFLPINQNIDYDYPIFHSFFTPEVFLSFLFLLSVFGSALYLFYRSKFKPDLRLISFGVFWFFITLSVESSIIPIPMVINEYRVYLPSAGAFWALVTGIALFYERKKSGKIWLVIALCLTIFILAYAAYSRNNLWGRRVTLWEDVVGHSPKKHRVHFNLAQAYGSEGMPDKAIEHFQIAINLNPHYEEAHSCLGAVYLSRGLPDKAIGHLELAVKQKPEDAEAHYYLANAYYRKGITDKAVEHYLRVISIEPEHDSARFNLALIYLQSGDTGKSREEFEAVLRINPAHPQAKRFLDYIQN
ncbi:MAG: tetratricopeptide repeat protein [Thermodesulfovibrionales bacterium]|nr:tetratricopeptide repeat protein [Thermodesulfovibrionales bacterium]